jgi:tRNA pseudouridine55 synthase
MDQVPSMFSAIKHNGQPLYKLARQGIEIEREARRVSIYSNELTAFDGLDVELEIHCSKGTYVRTIAEELGETLGCGAHVSALRRRQAGPYCEADLVTFEALEERLGSGTPDELLRPISSAVRDWPEVTLSDHTAYYLRQGQPVLVPHAPTSGWVRLLQATEGDRERFLGVGQILDDGRVAPRRLVVE